MQVTSNGSALAAGIARTQQFTPAFFVLGLLSNDKYIASTHADGSLLGPASPARPGEVIILYGTGFGPADPPLPNGQLPGAPVVLVNPVTLRIGGVTVRPSFAGLSAA